MKDRCAYPRCTRSSELTYLGIELCGQHFAMDGAKLRATLRLPPYLHDKTAKELRSLCQERNVEYDKRWQPSQLRRALYAAGYP